ncbi:hypothetical protein [Labrys miyagiensis]
MHTTAGDIGDAAQDWQILLTDYVFLDKLRDGVNQDLSQRKISPQPGTILVSRMLVEQNESNGRRLISASYMGSGATNDDAFRDGFANSNPDGDLKAAATREYFATTRYLNGQVVTTFGGLTPEFRDRMIKEGATLREERRIAARRKIVSDRQRATYPSAVENLARDLARPPPRPGPALKFDPTEVTGGMPLPPTRGGEAGPHVQPIEITPPRVAPQSPPPPNPSFQNSVILPSQP